MLFADATEVEAETSENVPAEVEAMDGVDSKEEAHNVERPARESLKKKQRPGKPLSEFSVGDSVTAKVKTITSYGAFMDIGAQTDGLLHISRLSQDFVKDVNEVLKAGQELEVRIVSIDSDKNQVALSLLTEVQEEKQAADQQQSRPKRQERQQQQSSRRDDSAVLSALQQKGWDTGAFVEGTVASTVAFGAFVRLDAKQLNSEVEGELDGLVHISALTTGRADSVTSIVNVGDKVKVRCKGIQGGKVSLSMINQEDEQQSRGGGGGAPAFEGAKDWKESLEKMQETMPGFHNRPLVIDTRK
jgi:elongation factor Ts